MMSISVLAVLAASVAWESGATVIAHGLTLAIPSAQRAIGEHHVS